MGNGGVTVDMVTAVSLLLATLKRLGVRNNTAMGVCRFVSVTLA